MVAGVKNESFLSAKKIEPSIKKQLSKTLGPKKLFFLNLLIFT